MIILSPSSSFSSLSTPSSTKSFSSSKIALREDDSYLNCAHSQISREGGLRGYYEDGDENDNDLHHDYVHENNDVNDDDEMKLNLLEQKPELQLVLEVDRRATNRWKGQGGSQQPRIIIIIIIIIILVLHISLFARPKMNLISRPMPIKILSMSSSPSENAINLTVDSIETSSHDWRRRHN